MRPTDRKLVEEGFWNKRVTTNRRFFRRNWYGFANQYLWHRALEALGDLRGHRLLFVGCGTASTAARDLAERGAEVFCEDISPESIRHLMQYAFGETQARIHPIVADAEQLPFGGNVFDAVIGKAIVHHLDVAAFMQEIDRVCVRGAILLFSEPLGTNPLINLFRLLTPSLRVPTEHPLRRHDIELIRRCCDSFEQHHHFLFSMVGFPWFFLGLPRIGRIFFNAGCWLDHLVFRALPPVKWLAWSVTLVGRTRGAAREI
jgi:ubiquinone/menaquinone biosynthesis C-methylase UbiE